MKGQHCRETQSNVHRESVAFACFDRWWTPQHSAGHCCQRTSRLVWRRAPLWGQLSARWSPWCRCAPSTSFQLKEAWSALWNLSISMYVCSYAWSESIYFCDKISNCDMHVKKLCFPKKYFSPHSFVWAKMIHNKQVTWSGLLQYWCSLMHNSHQSF